MCSLAAVAPAPAAATLSASGPTSILQQQQAAAFSEQALEAGFAAAGATGRQRLSMSPSHTKGLLNAPGQNNCFLNSAVQVLWHLDVFRRSFRHLVGHACMASSCIFCALKAIFKQFQSSDKSALPPDGLRRALARTFADQQRFQLGIMDDAAECFENILLRIHTHIAPDESVDDCRAAHCIPHRKFTMAIVEKVNCLACGAASEPFPYDEMVYYVSTTALVAEAAAEYAVKRSCGNFAQLLRQTVCKGDVRPCPAGCGASCEKQRFLQNCPDVVSIGLVWDSDKAHSHHIQDTMYCIGTSLHLNELFHAAPALDGRAQASPLSSRPKELSLVGIVCYYGMHYSTYFFHSKIKEWIYFDDAMVHQVSSSWDTVVDRICRGRHQPLLLLYMNTESSPLNTVTAPRNITMVEGYKWNEGTMLNSTSGAAKLTRPHSLASSAVGLPNSEGCRRSLSNPGNGYVPAVRSSLDSSMRSLGGLPDSSVASGLPTASGSRAAGGRRAASVSSSASVTLDETIFEYDTQSSVLSCDSTSLLGSDCMSLGGGSAREPTGCDESAGACRGGRNSVPPSWAPLSRPSSAALAVRRSASVLSNVSDHLEPPAQFANPAAAAAAHQLPASEAAPQRSSCGSSGSSTALASHEPEGPARLAAAHQVRGEVRATAPAAVTGHEPPAESSWNPTSPTSQTSPVYIKPPLLYGTATSGGGGGGSSSSGAAGKATVAGDRGGDSRYINPSRVEAVLSQQMRLSKSQQQQVQVAGSGDAADRPHRRSGRSSSSSSGGGGIGMLRPSHDLPMAGDALAAAAAASRALSVDAATAAAAAECTSLASSTNDSGYRSSGSTSSGGGWLTSVRSPSSLSLLESPPSTAAAGDSPFDFGSHRDNGGGGGGGSGGGSAGPKTSWPGSAALPWDRGQPAAQQRSVPVPKRVADVVPPQPASGVVPAAPAELPARSAEFKVEPASPRVQWAGSSSSVLQQHGRLQQTAGAAGGLITAADPNARRSDATAAAARECSAAAAEDTVVGGSAMYDSLCAQADNLLAKARLLEGSSSDSNLVAALAHYQHAIEALKKAMAVEANDAPALLYAQQKHDACIVHSETIHRRMAAVHKGPDVAAVTAVEQKASTRVEALISPRSYAGVPSMLTSDGAAWSKAVPRRSAPATAIQGATGAAAAAPGRFGYGASTAGGLPSAPAKVTAASARAAYEPANGPAAAAAADTSAGGSGSRDDGSSLQLELASGHAAAAATAAAIAEGRRMRQPAGHSSIPQGTRIATLRSTQAAGAAARASPESTPCTSPRPATAAVDRSTVQQQQQQLRPLGSGSVHQIPQPRCGSACSSVSSSSVSSVGCSPRDTGLPRPTRSGDSLPAAARSRRRPGGGSSSAAAVDSPPLPAPGCRSPQPTAAVGAVERQPVAQARGSPQLTRHGIRQLLVADMKKRMQDGQSPRTVAVAGPQQQQQSLQQQQPQRHLAPPVQYSSGQWSRADSGQESGQDKRDARASALAYTPRLGDRPSAAASLARGSGSSIPAPATPTTAAAARARAAAVRSSSDVADLSSLGAPPSSALASGRGRFGSGGGKAVAELATAARHLPAR